MFKGQTPVIVLGSHIVGLAIIRSLGKIGIPVVALYYRQSDMAHMSRYVKKRIHIIHPGKDEKKFVNNIHELRKDYPKALLVPTDDYSVVAISKNRDMLSNYFNLAVNEWDTVRKIIHKQEIYEIANSIGILCPKSIQPNSKYDLRKITNEINFPCLLKPCEGHLFYDYFKEKMFYVQDYKDILIKYKKCKDIKTDVMIQEIIPGQPSANINYNSYFVNGEPIAEFTARKVRVDPPFFGSPRVLVSEYIPEIIQLGRRLLRELHYEGFSCMEFKRDERDGYYKLMEINCRHNLTGLLAPYCGINFPWIMYNHIINNRVSKQKYEYNVGIYWIDLLKDAFRFFTSRHKEDVSINQYIKPYMHTKVFAVLDPMDPMPFIKRISSPFEKLISKFYIQRDFFQQVAK